MFYDFLFKEKMKEIISYIYNIRIAKATWQIISRYDNGAISLNPTTTCNKVAKAHNKVHAFVNQTLIKQVTELQA